MELFTAGKSNRAPTSGLSGVGYISGAAAVGKWRPKLPVSGPGVEAEWSEGGKIIRWSGEEKPS